MTSVKDWRYWRNLVLFGLCSLIVGLAVVITWFSYRGAQGYVHPARFPSAKGETPALFGVFYEPVILETEDGLNLAGWYTPPENGVIILVAHGYVDSRSAEMHAFFAREGYGVVSWDFRAHGESEGELCSLGYYEALDVEAALDYALRQEKVEHVGAWGWSMGGAAIIEAAARRAEIEAVAVDSVFPAVEEELEIAVRLQVMRPLVRFFVERETGLGADMLRPVDQIGRLSPRPVFIIQGMADDAIPEDSAERLYAAAGEPRLMWVEEGVGHIEMHKVYPKEYRERVIGFFDDALLKR